MSRRRRPVDDRDRRTTWQVASVLLGYPDDTLVALLPGLRRMVAPLPHSVRDPLDSWLDDAAGTAQLELARRYVETFDHQRRCCLYLTYYAYGDTRRRGMALLAFRTAYRAAGLVPPDDELPDHLAVVLEYAACTEPPAGERLLVDHRAGLELLRLALTDARSSYRQILDAVSATLPPLDGSQREAVRRLAEQGPPAEEVGLQPFGALDPLTSGPAQPGTTEWLGATIGVRS